MRPAAKQLDDQLPLVTLPSSLTEAHSLTFAADFRKLAGLFCRRVQLWIRARYQNRAQCHTASLTTRTSSRFTVVSPPTNSQLALRSQMMFMKSRTMRSSYAKESDKTHDSKWKDRLESSSLKTHGAGMVAPTDCTGEASQTQPPSPVYKPAYTGRCQQSIPQLKTWMVLAPPKRGVNHAFTSFHAPACRVTQQ